ACRARRRFRRAPRRARFPRPTPGRPPERSPSNRAAQDDPAASGRDVGARAVPGPPPAAGAPAGGVRCRFEEMSNRGRQKAARAWNSGASEGDDRGTAVASSRLHAMNIRFTSSLTPEDENLIAPVLLKAFAAILE